MESSTAIATAIDAGIDFTGGTLGGIATVLVGQPLDTVKVKVQTYPQLYKSSYQCFMTTFHTEGLARGLYRGTIPSLAANVAENSVLFCAYGMCQSTVAKLAGKPSVELSTFHNASAGFMAAFFSSLTLCPTELIKCRLQALSELSRSGVKSGVKLDITPFQMTRQILQTEGIKGLYRGLVSTWIREMPGYFCFFGGYEGARELFCKPGQTRDDIGLARTALSGGLGGVALWLAIFPIDVVKSRIQVMSIDGSHHNFRSVTQQIFKNEGISAFYSGILPTLVRTIPATAALFVTYELTKRTLIPLLRPALVDS